MREDLPGWLDLEDLAAACYICNASGDELYEIETPAGIRTVCSHCNMILPREEDVYRDGDWPQG